MFDGGLIIKSVFFAYVKRSQLVVGWIVSAAASAAASASKLDIVFGLYGISYIIANAYDKFSIFAKFICIF